MAVRCKIEISVHNHPLPREKIREGQLPSDFFPGKQAAVPAQASELKSTIGAYTF